MEAPFNHTEHGGDLRGFAARYRIDENDIIDFSSNVNPLGIPDSVRRVYLESAADLSRYPDPASRALSTEIMRHFPVRCENVIAGNGAVALIGLAIRALAPKRALIIEPSFGEYRRLLEQHGAEIRSIALTPSNDFQLKPAAIADMLPGTDLLILGQPNNPTGAGLSRLETIDLLAAARAHGVFALIDEAFADWTPEISVAASVQENSPFMVVRSLTKFFALAGIRSGFALGPSRLIYSMKNLQETWSVNRIAEKLSVQAMRDLDFQERSRKWFREESAWFRAAVEALGVTIYPSLANFFLLRLPAAETEERFFDFLARRRIFIRASHGFAGLDDSYWRIALRLRKDNEQFLVGLNEWLRTAAKDKAIL